MLNLALDGIRQKARRNAEFARYIALQFKHRDLSPRLLAMVLPFLSAGVSYLSRDPLHFFVMFLTVALLSCPHCFNVLFNSPDTARLCGPSGEKTNHR